MSSQAVLIKKIFQKDNHHFAIEWTDGSFQNFKLHDLQMHCPCANCIDENTGKRISNPSSLHKDVRAHRIVSVGRYALRIDFTAGCSTGIFSFDMLRKIGGMHT